tara:strand:+ start:1020 stop:2456 length:1437 start_codon:yes stop_codon:yes gene_type:complete
MDKIVIYDTETTNSTIWGSIIEVGAVVVDKNLKEIGKLNIRGRMPEGEVPSAKALLVNSTSIDLLTKGNYSHYDFLGAVENFFSKCAPAMFMGWSNLNFDRRMFHFNFFKGNRYPYATHSSPNSEHDGLHIARAAQTLNSETLKTELTEAGNPSLALESLSRMQGFDTSASHTAYVDAQNSLKVLRIIKEKHKENWQTFLKTSTKSSVETILKSDGVYSIFENVKGRNMMYLVSTLHPNQCFHPSYASWGYLWDLRRDPEPLLDLSVDQLRETLKKFSPKALRVLKTNKAPVVCDKEFALKQKPYTDLNLETIKKRSQLVRNNENFCKNIQIINREAAEEKNQMKTQEDLLPEETLYEKFIPNKDTALFKTWHSSSWEDKLRLLDKFQDKRCCWFGQKIIFQEAPQILPPDLYKNIKSEIARRILSKNKEKWQTVNMAYTEIDYLRDQASNNDDENELRKLDEINAFIMSIEKKYEIA